MTPPELKTAPAAPDTEVLRYYPPMNDGRATRRLIAIKVLHTVAWSFFVVCILAVPAMAARGSFGLALLFAGVVMAEVIVLSANRWSCPLTPIAARYTEDRRDNFDIYLPEWLARHNKVIFGVLYVVGLAYLAVTWFVHGGNPP